MAKQPKPTWGGRLPGGLDATAWSFLHSLPHDRFLWPFDIDGTMAHVSGLTAAGVLTKAEASKLRAALKAIRAKPELIEDTDEDVHSAIERVLTKRLGPLGAKVHAGRSRNDQVATALRLWMRAELALLDGALRTCIATLADRAAETAAMLAPGYTHLQRAQPVSVGHWLCAHAWSFTRDLERVRLAHDMCNTSPLGAGALATSTLGIDPKVAAAELSFDGAFANSIDAVSDRDFLVDGAYAATMALTHLSRLAEEVVLWSSSEFGFLTLADDHATGSSMMPQKKNPDIAELARGTTGLGVGALTGLLVTLKGLPLAYDRDLQTDKQHVRDVLATTASALDAMRGLIATCTFDAKALTLAAADPALLATDAAEALVKDGMPFRKAHETVGKYVRDDTLGDHVGTATKAVKARSGPGGPSKTSVLRQVRALRKVIE